MSKSNTNSLERACAEFLKTMTPKDQGLEPTYRLYRKNCIRMWREVYGPDFVRRVEAIFKGSK